MKKRIGHVTNSSSTSFVLTTKEPLPPIYADQFKPISKDNLIEIFKQKKAYYFDYDDKAMCKLKEIGKFDDKQMDLIKLVEHNMLSEYLYILKKVENIDDPIYHLYVDRDYLYCAKELDYFVHNVATIVDEEGDL